MLQGPLDTSQMNLLLAHLLEFMPLQLKDQNTLAHTSRITGPDTNRLTDLQTCTSNTILKSGKKIFGMRKPSKFNVPGWNELAKEFSASYMQAVSHWNIPGRPRSGTLAELKCMARAAFILSQCYQNFKGENANDLWKEIIALNSKKESLPLTVGGTSLESIWKDNFSAIANSAGSNNNRDQVMNAVTAVPGHNDVIIVHELR